MDGDRFDGVARSVARVRLGRRAVGGAVAALLAAGAVETEAKKKRCPRAKKCGKDCCGEARCFPKKVEPDQGDDIRVVERGCCPAGQICRIEEGQISDNDQCCYPDEECRPGLASSQPTLETGNCCRTCGSVCCRSTQKCINSTCEEFYNPPRLVRNRR